MSSLHIVTVHHTGGYTLSRQILPLDGSTPWGGPEISMGQIFRQAQREGYRRCQSRVFRHLGTPLAEHVGYYFVGRHPTEDGTDTFIRGVWVVVADVPPPPCDQFSAPTASVRVDR